MNRQPAAGSRPLPVLLGLLMAGPLCAQTVPQLPDSTGWGVHVLALARAPDSAIWAGTYGQGIFVLRPHATAWEHIAESDDTSKHSIGDVPAGEYVMGVEIEGKKIYRTVHVEPGKLTWVEFRLDAH